ncbi:MAG: glycosyltransferase family 4 protein [bacterium]|nr:glycosyltransferase family 4 protein [bacterium]
MKILIATGIYPPDIGGPAQYARGVEEAWKKEGHQVKVLAFSAVCRTGVLNWKLPTGIRHLYYFLRVLCSLPGTDFVFSPDTFSAAFPALLACKLFRKKLIIRTGGDFLWEQYVERTGDLVLLKDFYVTHVKRFNRKEKIIFSLLRFLFRHVAATIFSTAWQRDIFEKPYGLNLKKCFIVENQYGQQTPHLEHTDKLKNVGMSKVFVGGTRELRWKNLARVQEAFAKVQKKGLPVSLVLQTGSHGKFLMDIEESYAVILASLGDISPNTILDAIALGKPFILTRETGLYDKLKDIGVWVNPEDVSDIAEKIEWLSDARNYEAQYAKIQAYSFTHSYEQISNEIMNIYART